MFRLDPNDRNFNALYELFTGINREPLIAQKFLPAVAKGDKRIILVDGEPVGAINRVPLEGETRSNMHVGGRPEKVGLTERDREICAAIGPLLREKGQIFVGIDVIGDWLTEINVTSPTGLQELERFDGINATAKIWEAIERRRGLMSLAALGARPLAAAGREAAARARALGRRRPRPAGARWRALLPAPGVAAGGGAGSAARARRCALARARRRAACCSGCTAAPTASARRAPTSRMVAALAAPGRDRRGAARLPAARPSTRSRPRSRTPRRLGGAPRRGLAGRRGSRSAATAPAAVSPSRCCTCCSPTASRRRPASSPSAPGST